MAEETRIIRLKLEDAEKVRRELEEIKRLRDELSKPTSGGGSAGGLSPGGPGAGPSPAMTGGGTSATGFVASMGPTTLLGPGSAAEFARMAENIVRQSVSDLVQRPLQNAMGRIAHSHGPLVGQGTGDVIVRGGGRGSRARPISGPSVIVPSALNLADPSWGEIEEALLSLPADVSVGIGGVNPHELLWQRRMAAAGYNAAGVSAAQAVVPWMGRAPGIAQFQGGMAAMLAREGAGTDDVIRLYGIGGPRGVVPAGPVRGGYDPGFRWFSEGTDIVPMGGSRTERESGAWGAARGRPVMDRSVSWRRATTAMVEHPGWISGEPPRDLGWDFEYPYPNAPRDSRNRPAPADVGGGRRGGGGSTGSDDPLLRASSAAFGSAMLGMTFMFGVMPLQQFSQGNVTAAQQFTFDPTRAALNQRRTQAQVALGQQTEGFRQRVTDPLGIAALEGLSAAGLGGPIDAIATVGMGAGQFFNALSPVLASGVLAAAALPGPTRAAAGMVSQAGRLALPIGLGIGGMQATSAIAGLGGQVMQGMGAPDPIVQYLTMLASGPFNAMRQVVDGGGGAVGQWIGRQTGFSRVGEQPPPIDLRPAPIRAISSRQMAEAQRMQDEPQVVAAEREMLSRAETGLGLAQSRFRLGFAEQDLAISRRRFDEGQRMEREQLAIEGGRSAEDINTRFDRVIRGIDIGTMRRQRDIGISAGRAREDVGRSQARSLREVNIGEAESVEDVNTNFQRGVRDTILGSVLTGMPGALVQLALRRGDALQDVRRNAARGRSRIGRSTGDALTDIGIGERRALDDADTAARDAHGDAALGKSDAFKDLDREQQRRGDDLKKRQEAEARAFDEQEKRQKQMLVLAQAEIDIRQRLNEQLTATTPELIKQIQMITKAFETGSTDIDNARKRIREAQTGMMEGAAT